MLRYCQGIDIVWFKSRRMAKTTRIKFQTNCFRLVLFEFTHDVTTMTSISISKFYLAFKKCGHTSQSSETII